MKHHQVKGRLDVHKSDVSGSRFDDVNMSGRRVHNANKEAA